MILMPPKSRNNFNHIHEGHCSYITIGISGIPIHHLNIYRNV